MFRASQIKEKTPKKIETTSEVPIISKEEQKWQR